MLKNDLVFKLWDLANLTVAFSVAQAMAFFYMAAEKKLGTVVESAFAQCFTLTISLMGYAIYLGIIWGCQKGAKYLLSEADWSDISLIWSVATIFRYLIVIIFMVLSMILYYQLFK